MSVNVLAGSQENLDLMKGKDFRPQEGEGLVYLKVVFLKPETMKNGDPAQVVNDAQGVILCGQLTAIQNQINEWFAQSQQEYSA